MSIKNQIISGFLFILFLAFISLGILTYYLNKIGDASTELLEEHYRSVKASEELIISLVKIDRILSKICSGQHYDEYILLKVLKSERQLAKAHLGILKHNIIEPEEKEIFSKLEEVFEKYEKNVDIFPTSTDQAGLYFDLLQWQYEIMLQDCINLVDFNHNVINLKDKATHTLYFHSKVNTFLITIVVLLIVGIAIRELPDEIVKPIFDLSDRIRKISGKEYPENIEIDTKDELAELARSFKLVGEQLKETEEKFWLITENLYDVVFFSELDTTIFYTTPSIEKILGYRPAEVKNKKIFSLLHPHDIEKLRSLLTSFGHRHKNAIIELRIKKKNGHYLCMEVSYMYQCDEHGNPIYIQSTAWDISKRKRAEQKIRFALQKEQRLNEQLSKANAEIDQFMYSTSHNLRGPLASVLGIVDLIKSSDMPQEHTEMILLIEKSIHRLDRTIHEIIEYGRNNKLEVKVEPINFEILIQEVLEDLAFMEEVQKMEIRYQVQKEFIFFSDQRRLRVIFENLISNAIKYQNFGQPHPKLDILIRQSGKHALIIFEDNGIGVPPDHQERIFEMFHRATNRSAGAGLGLYIVQETLHKLKGTIQVSTNYGKGTTFVLKMLTLR